MSKVILLVEDNPNDVLFVQRACAKLNLDVDLRRVSDGEEAVAYLAQTGPFADRRSSPPPSLVLLDLKLPRQSGFDVLRWVRSDPTMRRLPIVILTSSSTSPDVNLAYELGANSYLCKPVRPDALTTLLQTLSTYWFDLNELPEMAERPEPPAR